MPARAGLLGIVALAAALALTPATAAAVIIPAVDYATVSGSQGGVYQGDIMTSTFMTADLTGQGGPGPSPIGQITSTVYLNGTVFTYVYQVTPSIAGESRFSTGFRPDLYNNSAGWDFTGAALVGAPGTGDNAFTSNGQPTGTAGGNLSSTNIGWTKNSSATGLWDGPDLVTFFIQSTVAPGVSTFNLASAANGTANGFAPVATPEASSLLLISFGVVGTVAIASRRRGFRANRAA